MSEYHVLKDLAIIFAVSLLVILIFHRIKLPALPGFIVAGVLLGPNALGLVSDAHQVESLAEVGVILLLFTIGIEFSLSRLREMGRQVVAGGGAQVGLTVALSCVLAMALHLSWRGSLLLGFLVALSSTAIVLKGLPGKGDIDAPHGPGNRGGGRVARLGGVPGGPRHLGVRLRPPGDGRALAVPRRVHLPVLRCGRHARAGRVLARAPGACPGRGRRDHGWEGPARRRRPGGDGVFGACGPAGRPRRLADRRVLLRAGA